MATKYDLEKKLKAAADGVRAQHGADAPNLFADALTELERLWAIERDLDTLFRPVHGLPDTKYYATDRTMAEASAERLKVGERLGIAVGALKPRKA